MSEEEKQVALLIHKELLRQAKPQLDTTSLQAIYDDLMLKMSDDPMREFMLPMAIEVLDVINIWHDKLSRFERALAHIEHTPAAALSHESLREASK